MPQLRLLPILLSILVASYASAAWGSIVAVNPVRIHLSAAKRSEQLKLTNNGQTAARFQITAHTWHETPDGKMQLAPTRDLLFFPSLLEIGPGQTRRVRVGSTVPPSSADRNYRIIIEELPPASKAAGQIQVLTRLNVPVFVQPAVPRPKPTLKTRVEGGQVLIALENRGNAYFKAASLRVIARSEQGAVLLDKTLTGWYVLAFGLRLYSLELPKDVCDKVVSVTTTVATERAKTSGVTRITPGSGCRR